jgi:hypothetical protein
MVELPPAPWQEAQAGRPRALSPVSYREPPLAGSALAAAPWAASAAEALPAKASDATSKDFTIAAPAAGKTHDSFKHPEKVEIFLQLQCSGHARVLPP